MKDMQEFDEHAEHELGKTLNESFNIRWICTEFEDGLWEWSFFSEFKAVGPQPSKAIKAGLLDNMKFLKDTSNTILRYIEKGQSNWAVPYKQAMKTVLARIGFCFEGMYYDYNYGK